MVSNPLPRASVVKHGELISQGRTADVFEFGRDCVLKVFRPPVTRHRVELEARNARCARAEGIPTPAVEDVIEVNGRLAIVFRRANGPTLQRAIYESPLCALSYLRRFALLHHDVHKAAADGFIDQRVMLRRQIRNAAGLSQGAKESHDHVVAEFAVGQRICHNDFHLGNVIETAQGLQIIDWSLAATGNPVSDASIAAFKLRRATGLFVNVAGLSWLRHGLGCASAALYWAFYPTLSRSDLRAREALAPVIRDIHEREYDITEAHAREKIRELMETTGIESAETWIEDAKEHGRLGEDALSRLAFSVFADRSPKKAIEHGLRALDLSPHDWNLRKRLNATRARMKARRKARRTT